MAAEQIGEYNGFLLLASGAEHDSNAKSSTNRSLRGWEVTPPLYPTKEAEVSTQIKLLFRSSSIPGHQRVTWHCTINIEQPNIQLAQKRQADQWILRYCSPYANTKHIGLSTLY